MGLEQKDLQSYIDGTEGVMSSSAREAFKELIDLRIEVARLKPYETELLKIAEAVGEKDDPFAAWEVIEPLFHAPFDDTQRIVFAKAPSDISPVDGMSFDYTNYRGETDERMVFPLRIWYGTTQHHTAPMGQWIITAYDYGKGQIRDFAWESIHKKGPV